MESKYQKKAVHQSKTLLYYKNYSSRREKKMHGFTQKIGG